MKLLLDENLSRRLVPFLLTAYPESTQVVLVGLEAAEKLRTLLASSAPSCPTDNKGYLLQ
jgi:predicted nuclease of predicted toxin-antitoxin system